MRLTIEYTVTDPKVLYRMQQEYKDIETDIKQSVEVKDVKVTFEKL